MTSVHDVTYDLLRSAAGASDFAMVDIMKIGGVTGWLSAMAQAEAATLPLSNHTFVEPNAHVMAVATTAPWFEYLDIDTIGPLAHHARTGSAT